MGDVELARRLRAADKAASLPFGSFMAMVHSSNSLSGCNPEDPLFSTIQPST